MTLELTTLKSLSETIAAWRAAGKKIALVPTMGAIHRGHLTLLERARERGAQVIVSIFVNPTQFGPNEDFTRYPRPRERDMFMLREEGADAIWLPTVEEIYPEGAVATIKVGEIGTMLEGEHRPGHFDGVVTVVSRLFELVKPDIALFGEKDYQQLCVIKQLVESHSLPIEVIGVPTVREEDGLALSSRNQYLSEEERHIAPRLDQVLRHSAFVMREEGREVAPTLQKAVRFLMDAGFSKVDYVALCDPETLQPLTRYQPHARLLVAAWIGKTRLIDNIDVTSPH